jgi:uncharacterized integral membrane protein
MLRIILRLVVLLLIASVSILVFTFLVLNTQHVKVDLMFFQTDLPLSVICLIIFLFALVIGYFISGLNRLLH